MLRSPLFLGLSLTLISCSPIPWPATSPWPRDDTNMACAASFPDTTAWADQPLQSAPAFAIRLPRSFIVAAPDSFAESTPGLAGAPWVQVTVRTRQAVEGYFAQHTTFIDGVPVRTTPGERSWCRLTLAGGDSYAGYAQHEGYASPAYSIIAFAPLTSHQFLKLEGVAHDSVAGLQLMAMVRSLHRRGAT